MILTALGWLAAIGLLVLAASSGWHGLRERSRGPWIAAGMYACAAVIMLAVLGVLAALTAGVLAFLALALATGLALAGGRDGAARDALGHAGEGAGRLGADVRSLWRRVTSRDDGPEEGSTEAVVAEAVSTRSIPSVMEDAALGLAPEPAELASPSVPAPAPYAALAAFIAGYEPSDDQELKMFIQGCAAGSVMVGDAWHTFADTCLNSLGLDPAYVAGVLEAGDSAAGHGSLLAQVHKRFGVIYQTIQEWVGAGRMLPHKAREFLTGEL